MCYNAQATAAPRHDLWDFYLDHPPKHSPFPQSNDGGHEGDEPNLDRELPEDLSRWLY